MSEEKLAGKSQSLVTQAYERIKEKIITLHFLPGQYLNEAAICSQLDLGRTPVHQALQRLHIEGLVEVIPRKGIIVQPDNFLEIMNILDSRLTVEPELARSSAIRVAAGEIETALLNDLRAAATASNPDETPADISSFTVNDRLFHRKLAQLSGNEVMSDFARMLHERSIRFWYLNMWQTINVQSTNDQHLEIAEAVINGDSELAARRMSDHIKSLRDRLKKVQLASPNPLRGL